jgi:hypothetical protein
MVSRRLQFQALIAHKNGGKSLRRTGTLNFSTHPCVTFA